ncbi:hypothetical protein Peur_067035 [Populus x canadensis]
MASHHQAVATSSSPSSNHLRRQVIAIPVQLRVMSIAAESSNSEQPLIQTVQHQLSLHLLCTVSSSGRSFSSAINWSRYNSFL